MRTPLRSALLSVLLLIALAACGTVPPAITGRVDQEDLASTIVGDSYRIQVRLPPGYDAAPAQRWPVVYQLDGTNFGPQFDVTAGYASSLAAAGKIPEVIVVGIGYPYDDPLVGGKQGRSRDYVTRQNNGQPGGADNFLRFLREELIPHVDGKYRTDPGARALSGHSLGGFVVLYAMLTTALAPALPFSRFIAGDPSFFVEDYRLLVEEARVTAATRSLPFRLYLEIARYDGAVQQLAFQEISERLRAHYPDLRLSTKVSETDHGGAIPTSFEGGLAFVFGGGAS